MVPPGQVCVPMSCHRTETAGLFWLSMDRQMLGRLRLFMSWDMAGGELVSHFYPPPACYGLFD
jgi:hypothetical protein